MMNTERRKDEQECIIPSNEDKRCRKPVIIYIMILFIAAFLLMALSFLMHQRSNSEALGALQSSVSTIQEVQASQEKIIQLQEELATTEDQLDALETAHQVELQKMQNLLDNQKTACDAMTNLYLLEQAYHSNDYEACQAIIQGMEETHQVDALTIDNSSENLIFPSFYNSPRLRFDQLKEAVETQLAE